MTDQSKRTPQDYWITYGHAYPSKELEEEKPGTISFHVREVTGEPTFTLSEVLPLVEALKFYAESGNWGLDYERTMELNKDKTDCSQGLYTSILGDTDASGISLGHIISSVGGSGAREALAQFQKLLDSKK